MRRLSEAQAREELARALHVPTWAQPSPHKRLSPQRGLWARWSAPKGIQWPSVGAYGALAALWLWILWQSVPHLLG